MDMEEVEEGGVGLSLMLSAASIPTRVGTLPTYPGDKLELCRFTAGLCFMQGSTWHVINLCHLQPRLNYYV
jgi:hypothetical protein